MSIRIEDYIPFDYMRYSTEILPAIEQVTRGNATALSDMLASATHFSAKLRSKYALPLSEKQSSRLIEPFVGLFDVPTLRSIRAGASWNPWEALAAVLPMLEGKSLTTLGKYGVMLKYHLLATFCCEVPPWPRNWPNPYGPFSSNESYAGPEIWHDEVGFAWHEYCARDEETQALWGAFYRPAPPDLERMLRIDDEQRSSYMYKYEPRYIPTETYTETEMGISGFMTLEEIQYLLEHVRTHERPLLDSIIDECVRDGEGRYWAIDIEALDKDAIKSEEEIGEEWWHYIKRPGMYISNRAVFEQWMRVPHHQAEMEQHHMQRFYGMLHMIEDEILHRMRFAIARGWGILVTNAKL